MATEINHNQQPGYTAETLVQASQNASGDLSAQSMLVKVFGTIADNPLAALDGSNGSGDILGTIFMYINMGLLTLGAIYLSYKALAAVTQTAHDGNFMGKSFHSVWVPIRITTGIFSLIPIAGGWSLLQVAMLWFGIMGAGLGNMAWQGVVGSGWTPFQTAALRPQPGTSTDRQLVPELFRMHVCVQTHNYQVGEAGQWGIRQSVGSPGKPEELRFGSERGKNAECGKIYLAHTSQNVGNSAQRRTVEAAVNAELMNLSNSIEQRAAVFSVNAARIIYDFNSDGPRPTAPTAAEFASTSREYNLRLQRAIAAAVAQTDALPAAHQEMQRRAQSEGFTTAGAFYSTLARSAHQINSLTANASPTIAASPIPPRSDESVWHLANGYLNAASEREQDGRATSSAAAGNEDAAWKLVMSEMGTDSIGQGIVNRITQDEEGQPVLLRLKNLADYMIGTASAAITGIGAVEGAIKAAESVPVAGTVASGVSGALSRWLDIGGTAAAIAMGFFLMASILLPMIPFITYLGQVLNWLITVVEGVAAAPFLAFAHLDTDGEGLGQRTQYGYTFMLASFMRPVMLVLGFVFACILLEVIGGFVMQLYPTALADAQGDSMTGFFSILGFTALFFVLCAGLINSCMSVTYLLPDAIFQFIGAHVSATAQIGRDGATAMTGSAMAGAGVTRNAFQIKREPKQVGKRPDGPANAIAAA